MLTTFATPAPFGVKIHVAPPDQRRERRYNIPKGMKLRVQTSRQSELLDAELRDISRNGVGLMSPRLISPGESISLPFGSQRIFAQVRYCCPAGAGFVVGALILEVVTEETTPSLRA